MLHLLALGLFLFFMSDNIVLALGSWFLFMCFIKPDSLHF